MPDETKRPFLQIADFIKVDFLVSNAVARKAIYTMASRSEVIFLAEKVESEADVQIALAEGCALFQGYYFSKPTIITTCVIPQHHAVYLRLLAALTRVPAEISEIESLVLPDALLCYRLLRLVNSPIYGIRSTIASIRGALLIVGDDEFRKMVTEALVGLAGKTQSKAVLQMALERARFCELLAPLINESAPRLYLLGMLSLIDVILAMPMTQIVDSLPVDREMKAALLRENSPLSIALNLVRCHETGEWGEDADLQIAIGLRDNTTSSMYIEAVRWADLASHAVST